MKKLRVLLPALMLPLAACMDVAAPVAPPETASFGQGSANSDLAAWFALSSPEVLALPGTVFANHDEAAGRLVFGVANPRAIQGVRTALSRLRIPEGAFVVEVTEPIHFLTSLRDKHNTSVGGLQIHWSSYVCTLGFNVAHAAGRSFITNSHCTEQQGTTGTTAYHQPSRTISPTAIAIEADDPAYFKGGVCPRGRVCRYSDAARAAYQADAASAQGVIAKPTGKNTGTLETASTSFTITEQRDQGTSFSGEIHKVGRTTGWTSGNVSASCANVNVSSSNITLLCQTMVSRLDASYAIAQGGDSGSPAFRITSGDNVELVGILWGGATDGSRFVFSPFQQIQQELGTMAAKAAGTVSPPSDGGGGDEPKPCTPRGNGNNCK